MGKFALEPLRALAVLGERRTRSLVKKSILLTIWPRTCAEASERAATYEVAFVLGPNTLSPGWVIDVRVGARRSPLTGTFFPPVETGPV